DEEAALLALERARERLANMPRNASALDWAEAELAVKQAELALKEAQQRTKDLREETERAAEAGIDGNEKVQDAEERVEDSLQDLADAQRDLVDARTDGAKDIADAEEALRQAQIDGEQQVADARERLRQAELDGARSVADARERLRQAEIDGARQVEDAERSLARARQQAAWAAEDSARAIEDAQRRLAEALADQARQGEAAAGGINKAAQAMANLSPAAQELVRTLAALKPQWDAIRLDVQERLLTGVADKVRLLADRYFPLLHNVLGSVADSFNRAFHDVSDLLLTERATQDLTKGFGNVTRAIDTVTKAARPLTQIFIDLFAVGSEFLPDLARGFLDAANRARDFVSRSRETGQLREWIQGGIDAIKQLGQLVGNVGSIIFTVFKAADEQGAGFLDTLVRLTGEVKNFLRSAEGQELLQEFFSSLRATVDALMPGLRALGSALKDAIIALAPVLPDLGDAFSALAEAAAPVIRDFAELAADILPPILDWIEDMAPVLGPATVAWIALGGAVKGVNTVLKLLTPITTIARWASGIVGHFDKIGGAADRNKKKMGSFFDSLRGGKLGGLGKAALGGGAILAGAGVAGALAPDRKST